MPLPPRPPLPFSDDACKKVAFWFERVAAILVVLCWIPSEPSYFLFPAVLLFICTNFVYFVTYIDPQPQESGKDKHGTEHKNIEQEKYKLDLSLKVSKEEVIAKDGRNKMEVENPGQGKASSKESKEEVKARKEGNNEETTRQEKDLSPKESKEDGKPKGEGNGPNGKRDEENTPQKKAELEVKDERNKIDLNWKSKVEVDLMELKVCVEEMMEQLRRYNEKFQSFEPKDLSKIKKQVGELTKNSSKLQEWEEERSQLMFELGSARALIEIYRDLLHGSPP